MWPELSLGVVTLKATWKMGLKKYLTRRQDRGREESGQDREESEGLGLAGPGRVMTALWEECSKTRPGKHYTALEFTRAE